MSRLPYAWAKAQRILLCNGVLTVCPSTPGWSISEVRRQFGATQVERVRDDELDGFIRDHAESAYHPCGTCRMGRADDADAVVDPETRVIGVDGLRVADSSIFPRVTNGNLNGPSIMTGEKAADHILGRTPLAPSNLEPWMNPDWRDTDRLA